MDTPASRKDAASKYVSGLRVGKTDMDGARCIAHFPPLVHVFTHIRLTMHVHQFEVSSNDTEVADEDDTGPPTRRWVEGAAMDQQTLSTGMRKCWELIAKAD
jgi:A/G-specific adenine glycosylase